MRELEPLPLDEAVDGAASPAKDNDGVPYCRKHHCRMKHQSGGKKGSAVAYYRCPVAGCEEKDKRIRTAHPGVVPAQPLACPRCSKVQAVYCERDESVSSAARVVLKCPACGWKSNAMVVPQLAAAQFARRSEPAIAHIGDR